MSLSPPPGTSLDRTLNAAKASEYPSAWVDGSDTNATTSFMDGESLTPEDNLSDFGLGPC
jgi:hypothetical protein